MYTIRNELYFNYICLKVTKSQNELKFIKYLYEKIKIFSYIVY